MLSAKITIDKGVARAGRLPDDVRATLKTEAQDIAKQLRANARAKAASIFKVNTGKYVKSIRTSVRTSKTAVNGKLYSSSPLANIFEWGDANIPAHVIAVKNAKALHFISAMGMYGASEGFAAHVNDPGGTIRQRSAIVATFTEEKDEIEQRMRDALAEGVRANQASA